jgi:hypothetical protein
MGHAEIRQELLVGGGLLEWIQILPMNVLDQGVPQEMVFFRNSYNRGNRGQASEPGRARPTLAHHDLEAIFERAHHDGL